MVQPERISEFVNNSGASFFMPIYEKLIGGSGMSQRRPAGRIQQTLQEKA
jgi:hypothetical protein